MFLRLKTRVRISVELKLARGIFSKSTSHKTETILLRHFAAWKMRKHWRGRFSFAGVAKSGPLGRRQQLHGVRQGVQSLRHRNGRAGAPDGRTAKRPERRTAAVSDCRGPASTRAVHDAVADFVQGECGHCGTSIPPNDVDTPLWDITRCVHAGLRAVFVLGHT